MEHSTGIKSGLGGGGGGGVAAPLDMERTLNRMTEANPSCRYTIKWAQQGLPLQVKFGSESEYTRIDLRAYGKITNFPGGSMPPDLPRFGGLCAFRLAPLPKNIFLHPRAAY